MDDPRKTRHRDRHSVLERVERVDHRADHRADSSGLGRIVKPGTLLKQKWTVDKLLGIGGMAAVYAATHRNGKRVAIKMLHEEHARNVEVTTRFLREGYLANAVDHEGVVSVLDDDVTDEGVVFLVMELLEGETVERRWERRERRIPVVEALSIVSELLDILAAAHAKGVIHRDIKPENIFLTRTGKVKVLDFGIARLRQVSSGMMATQSGTLMGTPAFMAPEQARGRWDDVDARTDLWAVGATLFALLSGRFVHRAKTLNEQFFVAMTSVAPKIRTILPTLPAEVATVIDRALEFRPEDRWQDARAMQRAIRKGYAVVRGVSADNAAGFAGPLASLAATGERPARRENDSELLRSLDFGAPATPTVEQGVTHAPSAAPELRASPRRSPIFVGIGAGALGIALALTALLHRPLAGLPGAMASMHARMEVGSPIILSAPAAGGPEADPAIAASVKSVPSPPATGVPLSMTADAGPPKRHVTVAAPATALMSVIPATAATSPASTSSVVTAASLAAPAAAPASTVPASAAPASAVPASGASRIEPAVAPAVETSNASDAVSEPER